MIRTAFAAFAATLVIFLTGCGNPAVSVRPLYTAGEKPAAEPRLEGQWVPDNPDLTTAQPMNVTADKDGCYSVRAQQASKDTDKDQENGKDKNKEVRSETLKVCLVRLQGKLFFDSTLLHKTFGAREISANDLGAGVTANHIIGRLWVGKGLLRLVRLDSKWVGDNTPEDFRQMRDPGVIITGSTAELRKIVTEHADDSSAWTDATYFCRPAIDCPLLVTEDRLARSPDDPEVLDDAGSFYLMRGDYAKAVSLQRHAVELKPDKASAHGYLALGLGYQKDFEGARRELAAAQKLESQPEDKWFYQFYSAFSYFLEGRYQEAVREFAALRAAEKKPEVAEILFQYFAMLRAGRAREGKAFLDREAGRFVGFSDDQLLLLEAAGRVTDPTWSQMGKDSESDTVLLYGENCLAQGNIKAARAAFEYVVHKPDTDPVIALTARIELERLDKDKATKMKAAKMKAVK